MNSGAGDLRSGQLTVDLHSQEAWKDGQKLALQQQPLQILAMLLERPGEIVTREELRARLWPDGTFVDFDHSLNTAVKKLRQALGDSAEEPRYIETLPRVGYRLLSAPAEEKVRRPPWKLAIPALLLALIATAGIWLARRPPQIPPDASTLSVRRLTSLGNVTQAVVSPDGRFFCYGMNEQGQQSLWIQQIGFGPPVQLVPPGPIPIWSAQFTPDGKFVYYAIRDPALPEKKLYRVPAAGGEPDEILTGIESGEVAFSPDGSKFAYLRANYPTRKQSAVLVANADGSDPTVIATRELPERFAEIFFTAPSWSPDGRWIAAAVRRTTASDPQGELVIMRPDGSDQQRISDHPWIFVGQSEWLPDMSGLLVIATDRRPIITTQVWLLPFPRGKPRRITNDLLGHRSVSLSTDGSVLVTVASDTESAVWQVPRSGGGRPRKLTHSNYDGYLGVEATRDGEVVFAGHRDGRFELFRFDAKGMTHRIPLLDRPSIYPAVSVNGDVVFHVPEGAIFTSRLDGSALRKLANGILPAFTPDGKAVIFQNQDSLLKIPIEGGAPVQLTDYFASQATVSPDGTLIAAKCKLPDEPLQLCVIPIVGGPPVKRFPFSQFDEDIHWSHDGQGILMVGAPGDDANIYLQPLDGSALRRATDLGDMPIFSFAVPPDGSSLLIARGRITRDALLITGFR